MIPEGFITNLLDRADIVDVVSRYVPLKKAGRNYMCCCPFHKEKTPSFSVSPAKQFYKCFGCGKGGNAIGFVMEIEHLSFPEAVEKLAGYYGLEVPKDTSPRAQAAREKSKTLADFMKEAADYYTAQLRATPKAVEYLRARAISGETAARFGLGYSPEGWHALEEVFKEKYSAPALLEAGLVNEKNGRRYDAFRDRLMFPIRNPKYFGNCQFLLFQQCGSLLQTDILDEIACGKICQLFQLAVHMHPAQPDFGSEHFNIQRRIIQMFVHHFHNLVHQYLVTGLHCNFFHFILLLLSPAEFVTQQFAIGYQVGNSLFQQFRVERFHHISIGTGFHSLQSILRFGSGFQ